MDSATIDFHTFIYHDGLIIVSRNTKVNEELAANPKWGLFRKAGPFSVYADGDSLNRLFDEGLPPQVIKFILSFNG